MMNYKLMTVLTIIGSIIEIILYSTPVVFVGIIIELFLTQASSDIIITYLGYLLGLIIFQALFFYFVATINEILAHRVTTDMTADLFSALQSRPVEYHDRIAIGDIMARATSDTRVINIGLSPAIRLIMQIFTLIIYSLSIMLFLNYQLALILVITGPLYFYSIYRYAKKLLPVSSEIRERFGDLTIEVAESIRGIREIKSFVAEPYIIDRFDKSSMLHSVKVQEMGYKSAVYIPHLIIATTLGLTTSFGIILMLNGELTLPELVVFVGLISLIQWMSRNLQWIAEYSARTVASSRRLQEMLFEKINFLEFGDEEYTGVDTTIEFDNVWFRYDKTREWALKGINFTIKHNETIAIVGGPGSGKSTFSKLILRLYDPVEGGIKIQGRAISDFTEESLRKQFSSIEQDVFLFTDTIANNIAFGKPGAAHEDIKQAAALASAEEFINDMELGYDTIVGERGVKLSGGQKQRIAIARALLINPAILLIDDASSALDAETEQKIQNAIQNILQTRTSIIVTSRLSIIAEASRVLVFDKGEIVAEGPHDELIRTSTYYRRLFENHYELPPLIELSEGGAQ